MNTNTIHGHNTKAGKSPEYCSWDKMIQRCLNPRNHKYAEYGGRGIKVCERWLCFTEFLIDMGKRPSRDHTLDRKDVNGNYEPSNCRWATRKEQQRNRRVNRCIEYGGKTMCLPEFSELVGLTYNQAQWRLDNGWTPEQVANKKVKPTEMPIEIDGVVRNVSAWAELSPVSRTTIFRRLKSGMNPKDAVFLKKGNR